MNLEDIKIGDDVTDEILDVLPVGSFVAAEGWNGYVKTDDGWQETDPWGLIDIPRRDILSFGRPLVRFICDEADREEE